YLSDNKITKIEIRAFVNLPALRYLYLFDNDISELEIGAFANLPGLYGLYLSNNKISEIETGAFMNLAGLITLDLDHNLLTKMTNRTFVGMTGNLRYLLLRYNELSHIEDGAFLGISGLNNLYLSNNKISEIETGAFMNLAGLITLLQLLRRDIERASGGLITNEECAEFIPLLADMEKEVSARFEACRSDHYRSERVAVDGNGHFKFSISKEQLEYLVKYGFTAPMMSDVLGISESTVRRRLREFGLSLRKTTHITDMELDQSITEVIGTNRHIGPNSIRVHLAQKKIFVSREGVRTACARVDSDGCSLRSLERKNIKRRTYKVAGPNSLWHLDGNHG
ncbi:Hypothetical predicted protein, partial [Mytilus galloprovincialis]